MIIIDVLTKLANIWLDLNSYNWESLPPELSEPYKNLYSRNQVKYITSIHKKIEDLLNNTADTIISYQHFCRLGKTFDEWLLFQFRQSNKN